jgi:hypothetical protein
VVFGLCAEDWFEINLRETLGHTPDQTFLIMDNATIYDTAGIVLSPLLVHSFCMQHQVTWCAPITAIDTKWADRTCRRRRHPEMWRGGAATDPDPWPSTLNDHRWTP